MTPLAPHLAAFLNQRLAVERGASPHTCDSYAYAFQLLLVFAARKLASTPSQLSLEALDAPLILDFLEHLERDRGNSVASRNARLAAIKSFMRFLEHRVPQALEQIRRVLAIPSKKTDGRLITTLGREQLQALLDAPSPTTRGGIRDRAMLHLAFAAGLRVSELVGLRLDDLSFEPFAVITVRGKGRRERRLPLWKETSTALRAWLAVRPGAPVPELFLNASGKPMTRWGFRYVLRKSRSTAVPRCPSLAQTRVFPHLLRHCCAMNILQATHDLRKVALWLGHAHVETSEIYTRADPTEKLDAIAGVLPPNLRRGRFRPPQKLLDSLKLTKGAKHYVEQTAPNA
ncbi:MAG: tyrosine-type recombinase/integrase [Thermoleophilia bacterium]|nr:tyrosine-type recombinase/integrase [Thermoleophilia bacterium]